MLIGRFGPSELATGQSQQRYRIGLNHIRWRPAGMAPALAKAQLDGREWRDAQLNGAAGIADGQQPAYGSRSCCQLSGGQVDVRIAGQCRYGRAQPHDFGW